MRKKLSKDIKRNTYIGLKVQSITKNKLKFIASREALPVSTLIDQILKEYINNYFKVTHINWDTLSPEERGEENS